MLRLLLQKPLTQSEIIKKYSSDRTVKACSIKILAMDEQDQELPGHKLCIMA